MLQIEGAKTPVQVFNGGADAPDQPPILFCNANGFPPGCYLDLFAELEVNCVYGAHFRPLWQDWDPKLKGIWRLLTEDLIELAEALKASDTYAGQPIRLLGHSLGATVAIMAAERRPDLFAQLLLIEPVLLPKKILIPAMIAPKSLVRKRSPLATKTLRRPHLFESKQEAFDFHRKARVFNDFSDQAMWHYVNAGVRPTDEGHYQLSYCKHWEAEFYQTPPWLWHRLGRVKVPTTGLRGEHSDTLSVSCWQQWQKLQPSAEFIELSGAGHLLAMSHPNQVARVLNQALASAS